MSWADEPPILFLTVDARTKRIVNRYNKSNPEYAEEDKVLKHNFREEVAKRKPYKATRKKEKPYHYDNLTAYILNSYDCRLAEGLEADDLLAIVQTREAVRNQSEKAPTIICTRDKDLRQVEGMHFGWAVGEQSAFGPENVDFCGEIRLIEKSSKVIKGTGWKFFCSQLLTGDAVDNIPGLPLCGPVKAFNILKDITLPEDMLRAVRDAYREKYGDVWDKELLEQAQLLWMVREYDAEGCPVMFELPEYLYDC